MVDGEPSLALEAIYRALSLFCCQTPFSADGDCSKREKKHVNLSSLYLPPSKVCTKKRPEFVVDLSVWLASVTLLVTVAVDNSVINPEVMEQKAQSKQNESRITCACTR